MITSPRLLILVALAGGLAVFAASLASGPPRPSPEESLFVPGNDGAGRLVVQARKQLLRDRPLPGEDPPNPAELAVTWHVDPSGKRNRLYYDLTEANGYYVETFELDIYHVSDADDLPARPLTSKFLNDYVEANSTLAGCLDLGPAELWRVGGEMGTSDNWFIDVRAYGRARLQNPDPLPTLSEENRCR